MKKILLVLILILLTGCNNKQDTINLYDYNYGLSTNFLINKNVYNIEESSDSSFEMITLTDNSIKYSISITYNLLSNDEYYNLRNSLSNSKDINYSNLDGFENIDSEYNSCDIYLKIEMIDGEIYLLVINIKPLDYSENNGINDILNDENVKLILNNISVEK